MRENQGQQGEHRWGGIPETLRKRSQWVVTQDKRPIRPTTGWQKSKNQLPFSQAVKHSTKYSGEPAYVLHPDDPYVVIDMDDVGPDEPTKISTEAQTIVEDLRTYTEASRSNSGLHLICEGTRLPNRCESGKLDQQGKLEVFDGNHYVILTGNQIGQYETISEGYSVGEDGKDVLSELQRRYLPERDGQVETEEEPQSFDIESVSTESVSLRAKDIKRTIEEYAKSGSKEASRALSRWKSPAGSSRGFQSASEADLAFVADLAFWCREDRSLMNDCFRDSSRWRQKWNATHYSDGRTYGDGTIQTAVRSNYDTFSGHYVQKS